MRDIVDILVQRDYALRLAARHRSSEAIEILQGVLVQVRAMAESGHSESVDRAFVKELSFDLAEICTNSHQWVTAREVLERAGVCEGIRGRFELLWSDYYGGELARARAIAGELGDEIEVLSGRVRARAALLIGKIMNDSGCLGTARDWFLYGLSTARCAVDMDMAAACIGALGETMYLSGHALDAIELLDLDAALLGSGHMHVERLMVYRAHCYRQIGQLNAARSLYEEAVQASVLLGRKNAYAMRGLLWCSVLESTDAGLQKSALKVVERLLGELRDVHLANRHGEAHSLGHGLLGAAWAFSLVGDTGRSVALRGEAAAVFEEERYFLEAAFCKGEGWDMDVAGQEICLARRRVDACDAYFSGLELRSGPAGFEFASRAFHGTTIVDGLGWMGLFF